MSIRQVKIPGRQERSKDEAFFYTITTAQERHVIQSAAPTPFQVVNDQEEDGAWSRADAATLARWCAAKRGGWRVQSRAGGAKGRRCVWVSWDPDYWQRAKKGSR